MGRKHGRFKQKKGRRSRAIDDLWIRWSDLKIACKDQKIRRYGLNKNAKEATTAAANSMWSNQKSYPNVVPGNPPKKKKTTQKEKLQAFNKRAKTRLEMEVESKEREKLNCESIQSMAASMATLSKAYEQQKSPAQILGQLMYFVAVTMSDSDRAGLDMNVVRGNQDVFVALWTALEGKSDTEKIAGLKQTAAVFAPLQNK